MSAGKSPPHGNSNPQVDAWFRKLDHPLKHTMQLVRSIILDADDLITESIKWSAPTFEYEGNLASFQPKSKRFVSLMFHRGSEIPGSHPGLEGEGALVRIMRFGDEAGVEAQMTLCPGSPINNYVEGYSYEPHHFTCHLSRTDRLPAE